MRFYSRTTLCSQVYRLELPQTYESFWQAFNVLNPFDLERRLPCNVNTHNGILFLGVWPLTVMAVIVTASILWSALAPRLSDFAPPFDMKRALLRGLPPSLIVMFGVVPSISVQLFSSFNCVVYEDTALANSPSRSFMLDDPSVSCDEGTEEYELLRTRSYAFIFVWPVGATTVCALLLYKARHAIIEQKSTQLSRALEFLHQEYEAPFYYWEVRRRSRWPSARRLRQHLLTPAPATTSCCP